MDQHIEKKEPVKVLPTLDITKFNHWEDHLYNLQVGETKLPDVDDHKSSEIGNYGFIMAKELVLNLREKRVDQDGKVTVIFEDEVPDNQLVIETNAEEINKYFLDVFISSAKRKWFGEMPDRADSYITSALVLGRAFTGLSINEMREQFKSKLSGNVGLQEEERQNLLEALENTNNQIGVLTDYLEFSESQMTNEERRVMVTAKKEEAQLGSEPIEIDGETYSFVGKPPIEITPKDKEILIPLQKATRRGRQEMVEQAMELAFQEFGVDREKNSNRKAPKWWMEAENGEPLKSNEVLLYVPGEARQINDLAPMFKTLLSEDDFRYGWNILTISKEYPNLIVGVTGLSN